MSEYIEKSVLLEAIGILRPDETMNLGAGAYITPYDAALEVFDCIKHEIRGAKPADVAPVVHGRWSKEMRFTEDFMGNRTYGYKCSVCGKLANRLPFCGNCGAKMDESEGEQ